IDPGKIAFVLWRVGDSQAEIRDARDYITKAGYNVLAGEVPDRTDYRRASDKGRAFTETSHKSLNLRADNVAQNIVNAINATHPRPKDNRKRGPAEPTEHTH